MNIKEQSTAIWLIAGMSGVWLLIQTSLAYFLWGRDQARLKRRRAWIAFAAVPILVFAGWILPGKATDPSNLLMIAFAASLLISTWLAIWLAQRLLARRDRKN